MNLLGIDILRHLLAIAVIIQHMHSKARYSIGTTENLTNFASHIDGAVICFFMLSGFFFREKPDLAAYIKGQFRRLFVPFILFSSVYAVGLAVLGKSPLSISLISISRIQGVGPQMYFLPILLVVTVTYAILEKLGRKFIQKSHLILLITLFLLTCSLIFTTQESTGPNSLLFPLYCLGFFTGRAFNISKNKKLAAFTIIILSLLIGVVDHRFYDFSLAFSCLAFAIWVSSYLPKARFPGSATVFLLHAPIVNYSMSIILVYFGIIETQNIVFSVIVTYMFCMIVFYTVMKFSPSYRWLLLE
jgi:Acyltransferase family